MLEIPRWNLGMVGNWSSEQDHAGIRRGPWRNVGSVPIDRGNRTDHRLARAFADPSEPAR